MNRVALVVEDEMDTGELLAELLRRRGFTPTHFVYGNPALLWAREHRPALILLDLMLPDADGYALCSSLKGGRVTNPCALVMVTARHLPEDRLRGFQMGADDYLVKPFTAGQLLQAVHAAVQRQEQIREQGTSGEIHFDSRDDLNHLTGLNRFHAALLQHTTLPEHFCQELTGTVETMGTSGVRWRTRHHLDNPIVLSYHIEAGQVHLALAGPTPPLSTHSDHPWEVWGLHSEDFNLLVNRNLVDRLAHDPVRNAVQLVKDFTPTLEDAGRRT
jgi:DNA-binding response OmpR family regulator